ncbi:MAG: zinc ribbon domain-containing protein [Terriglobia bacterium]
MQCPQCGHTNPEAAQFCTRCHTPLRYTCPACKHVQTHSGKCDRCGVVFAKYSGVLLYQMQTEADKARERRERRSSLIKQLLLLPLTGGLSLLRYFRPKGRKA